MTIDQLEQRVTSLETLVSNLLARGNPLELSAVAWQGPEEIQVAPWIHLVFRPHPWRRQLCIKGRNLTVRQLVGGMRANGLTPEQAAENYDLPLQAVQEALQYAEQNEALLNLESAFEQYLLEKRGIRIGAGSLP